MHLYDKIYQTASDNMAKDGKQFSFSKTAFESILYKDPAVIDAKEFIDMNIDDFIVSSYLRCLNRLPDESVYKSKDRWFANQAYDDMYAKSFFLQRIGCSAEFVINKKQIIYEKDIWSMIKKYGVIKTVRFKFYGSYAKVKTLLNQYIILPVWKRLPAKMKRIVRIVLGRERK